ncbi:MAG: hypothetical protein Q8T09_16670 [Candidatus Melainabacteria bacterium]|nr:hypothetical protein [Candidatus Melainabacteria bacterium]
MKEEIEVPSEEVSNSPVRTKQWPFDTATSPAPAAVSNLLQLAIWTSCLWYPVVSLYACCLATIVAAPFVSAELLPRFANSYIWFCYLLPPISFVALLFKSRWFRRWCHWFLLTWIGANMFTGITESALTSFCLRANTEFQRQFKPTTN